MGGTRTAPLTRRKGHSVLKLKSPIILAVLSLVLVACTTQPVSPPIEPETAAETDTPAAQPAKNSGKTKPVTVLSGIDEAVLEPDATEAALPPSVWDQFRRFTMLDLEQDNPRIAAERRFYQNNPDYLERVLTRAEPYLFYIQSEIERRGLPSELLLLPVVESAFDPFAYSHGRAAGLWQFIPGTGRMFGLKQTWWYEGRRDIVASTDAALTYLDRLQKQFDGDWLLALASYNAGAGNVMKAVTANKRRGKPTDFWSLDLRRETSDYVPRLIAISQIFMNPAKYNVTLRDIPYQPYFAQIDIGGQLDLAQAAKLAGISIEELYRLNPAFNRWATDPDGPHRLLIPVAQAEQFQLELASLPVDSRVKWNRYTIKSGDTVSTISRHFGITPELLKSVNGMANNNLRAGRTLLIPQSTKPLDSYALSADQRLQSKQNRTVSGKQKHMHTVKKGETFWSISRQYKVDMRQLAGWNNMAPKDPLTTGRQLVIWRNGSPTVAATAPTSRLQANRLRKIKYRARSGDSYAGIADKFNVSLSEIKRWNNVNMKKYLQPGDMLTLYVDVANAP